MPRVCHFRCRRGRPRCLNLRRHKTHSGEGLVEWSMCQCCAKGRYPLIEDLHLCSLVSFRNLPNGCLHLRTLHMESAPLLLHPFTPYVSQSHIEPLSRNDSFTNKPAHIYIYIYCTLIYIYTHAYTKEGISRGLVLP